MFVPIFSLCFAQNGGESRQRTVSLAFPVLRMRFSLLLYIACLVALCYLDYRFFDRRNVLTLPMSDSLRSSVPKAKVEENLQRFREKEVMAHVPTSIDSVDMANVVDDKETTTPSPIRRVWNWPSNETSVLPDFGTMETNRENAATRVTA